MINKANFILLISFFGYMFLYLFLFKNIVLFDRAFCLVYLAFLLTVQIDSNRIFALFIGAITGLVVDVFSDSLGIHMAACILLMYVRYYLVGWITPQGGYDSNALPTIRSMGLQWYLTYAIPLIFIHNVCLFYTEAGESSLFFFTLSKVILSSIFTLVMITLLQFLISSSSKRSI